MLLMKAKPTSLDTSPFIIHCESKRVLFPEVFDHYHGHTSAFKRSSTLHFCDNQLKCKIVSPTLVFAELSSAPDTLNGLPDWEPQEFRRTKNTSSGAAIATLLADGYLAAETASLNGLKHSEHQPFNIIQLPD